MFAILETGGKQYRVEEGDILDVELLQKDQIKDEQFTFETVLLLNGDQLQVGAPYVAGATVRARILAEIKTPKVIVFKKKSKKQYRRKRGHRQQMHRIAIEKIATV